MKLYQREVADDNMFDEHPVLGSRRAEVRYKGGLDVTILNHQLHKLWQARTTLRNRLGLLFQSTYQVPRYAAGARSAPGCRAAPGGADISRFELAVKLLVNFP